MNADETRKAVQRDLGVTPDGVFGPATKEAFMTLADLQDVIVPGLGEVPEVDARSEHNIQTLHPAVRLIARAFILNAAKAGITIKIIDGSRTYAEQDSLYAKGGATRARGGQSNHNFGLAFDIGIFDGSNYVPESPLYLKVATVGKALGLSWGGDWHDFKDEPHYELHPRWASGMGEDAMLAELRARHAAGTDQFA